MVLSMWSVPFTCVFVDPSVHKIAYLKNNTYINWKTQIRPTKNQLVLDIFIIIWLICTQFSVLNSQKYLNII